MNSSKKFTKIVQKCCYSKTWEIKENDKLLILAPHPDDESIGCGGLLLKYGKQVDIMVLTDGRYGNPEWSEEDTVKIRKKEFELAMKFIGINSYAFIEAEDSNLHKNFEKFKQIKKKLNNYDYIIIPNPSDMHPDHMIVKYMLDKIIPLRFKGKIVYYEIWSALSSPTHYIDISDIVNDKKDLINTYKSQIKHIDYASRILSLNNYRGILHNIKHEEAYQII